MGDGRGEEGRNGRTHVREADPLPLSDEAQALPHGPFPRRPKELAVRLGCGPCAEERAFLSRRKQVVATALKQALRLHGDLLEDEVRGRGRMGQAPRACSGPGPGAECWNWFPNQRRWCRARLSLPSPLMLSGAWPHQMWSIA